MQRSHRALPGSSHSRFASAKSIRYLTAAHASAISRGRCPQTTRCRSCSAQKENTVRNKRQRGDCSEVKSLAQQTANAVETQSLDQRPQPSELPHQGTPEFDLRCQQAMEKVCEKYAWTAQHGGIILRRNPLKLAPLQDYIFTRCGYRRSRPCIPI